MLKWADFDKCKTPEQAAKLFLDTLKDMGFGDEVLLWSPEKAESLGYSKAWSVCWEGGPFEWAMHISGGACMFYDEAMGMYMELKHEFPDAKPPNREDDRLVNHKAWMVEPYTSCILCFYKT